MLAAIPAVVALLIGGAVLALQLEPVSTWTANEALARLDPWAGTSVHVGKARLIGLRRLVLADLRVRRHGASTLFGLDTLDLRIRLLPLMRRTLAVRSLYVDDVHASMRRRPDSTWDALAPFAATSTAPADTSERTSSTVTIRLEKTRVRDASLAVRLAPDSTLRIEHLSLALDSLVLSPTVVAIDTLDARIVPPPGRGSPAHLSGSLELTSDRLRTPGIRLVSDSSDVRARGTLLLPGAAPPTHDTDFKLTADPLSFADLGDLHSGLSRSGDLRLDAHVTGSPELLTVHVQGRTSDGTRVSVDGSVTPRVHDSLDYVLHARVHGLDPGTWLSAAPPVHGLDGKVDLSLTGPSLDSLDGRVHARLSAAHVPGGTLTPTRVDATVRGGTASFTSEGGLSPWVRLTARGTARPFDARPSFQVRAELHQAEPARVAGGRLMSGIVTLRAKGVGLAPATARGHLRVGLSGTVGSVRVRGGSLTANWDSATARASLSMPVKQGRISANASADWSGSAVSLVLRSLRADSIELAGLLGDTIAGSVTLRGRGSATLGQANRTEAHVRLALESGRWGHLSLDTGRIALHLSDGDLAGHVRMVARNSTLSLTGHARPFAPVPTWRVDTLAVRRLDIAELLPGMPSTDIDGGLLLRGTGVDPASLRAHGVLELDSSKVGSIRIDTASARLSLRDGRLGVHARAAVLGGVVSAALEARPLAPTPLFHLAEARFDSIRVDSSMGLALPAVLTGTLTGVATLPPDSLPSLDAHMALESGRIGTAAVDSGRLEVGLRKDTARLAAMLSTDAGSADVHGSASVVGAARIEDMRGVRLQGSLDAPKLAKLLGRDSTPADLKARFSVRGSGVRPRTMRWSTTVAAAGRYGHARLDSLELVGQVDSGVVHLDTLSVDSNFLRGGGGGTIALLGDSTAGTADGLRLRLATDSVAALADLVQIHPLTLRTGHLSLDAGRRGDTVRLTGSFGAGGLIGASLSADTLHTTFLAEVRDGSLVHTSADVSGRSVAFSGRVLQRVAADLSWDAGAAAFTLEAHRDGRHQVRLVGVAWPNRHTLRVDSLDVGVPDRAWRLAHPDTVRWGDTIGADDFELAAGRSRLVVSGHLARSATQDLSVRLDSVPMRGLAELAGVGGMEVVVDGRAHIGGSASDPRLDGTLDASFGRAHAHVELQPTSGPALQVRMRATDGDSDSLTVSGTLPFALPHVPDTSVPSTKAAPPLHVDLAATSFSLAWLEPMLRPMGVHGFDAKLTADVHLAGPFSRPDLSGDLSLAKGSVDVPSQGIRYSGIHGRISFPGDRIRLTSFGVTSAGGGTLQVNGEVGLPYSKNPGLDLHARLHRFQAVDNLWARPRVTGQIALSGSLHAPVARGSIELENTDIRLDQLGMSGSSVQPVTLEAQDYRMLESYFGYRPSTTSGMPIGPFDRWDVKVSVRLGNDAWVRRQAQPDIQVQVGGSLDVRKQPGDSIQLFGTVQALPEHSYIEQFGRHFALSKGTVTFNGSVTSWRIDVEAQYQVPSRRDPTTPEALITMDIGGRADSLSLTLGSQPPMDNADILSYLATGRPAASATEFGNTGSGGSSSGSSGVLGVGERFALGQVAGALEQTAGKAVGLDVVDVRHTGLSGTTLVAGRYVNPRLFVAFRQPLSSDLHGDQTTQDPTARETEVQLEYTWYRWLLVNVEGAQSTLSLFLRTRYAY